MGKISPRGVNAVSLQHALLLMRGQKPKHLSRVCIYLGIAQIMSRVCIHMYLADYFIYRYCTYVHVNHSQ